MPRCRSLPTLTIATAILLVGSTQLSAQAPTSDPLRQPTAWPDNDLPRSVGPMGKLLAQKLRTGVDHGENEPLREQIYAIVSDLARRQYASTGSTAIPAPDSALATLFVEADRYGVVSANPIAHVLGIHSAPISPPSHEFSLELTGDRFTLSATLGRWRVQFPWYFMLWNADRVMQERTDTFDVVSLSTLTAANAPAVGGASQATILIVSRETDSIAPFIRNWLYTFGVSAWDTVPKVVPQALRSYRHVDRPRHMEMEVSVFKIPSGSLMVGYFGLEGTFEANRQAYLDLLRSMQVR